MDMLGQLSLFGKIAVISTKVVLVVQDRFAELVSQCFGLWVGDCEGLK